MNQKLLILALFGAVILIIINRLFIVFDLNNRSIDHGLEFLKNAQTNSGGFKIEWVDNNTSYESPLTVGLILDLLYEKLGDITAKKGIQYLISTEEEGLWRFYPNMGWPPLDVDDTAIAAKVLNDRDIGISQITVSTIEKYYSNGSFKTWINNTTFNDKSSECVALNAIYFLSNIEKNKTMEREICDRIFTTMTDSGYWNCSWYSNSPYPGIYFYSRNYAKIGMDCLESVKPKIISFLEKNQQDSGCWGRDGEANSLDTGLAILSLRYLNACENCIKLGERCLKSRQLPDGGWEFVSFCTNLGGNEKFGSRELTTAFAIAALSQNL